jgi:putative ATPase
MPLANKIRPATLDEIAGQTHLIGAGKPLRRIIESGEIPNMIFYGTSGVGKTTVANIIANQSNMTLYKLNGTSAKLDDIRAVIAQVQQPSAQLSLEERKTDNTGRILLYLDEIQYLNKKQQQSLLEYIENGEITLIASTTENPYFYVYGAILSRCTVFEFKPLTPGEVEPVIRRGFCDLSVSDEIIRIIAQGCGGDVRKSLNAVELCVLTAENRVVTAETARELVQKSAMRYDRAGDEHYDTLSVFQKAIRACDENTALVALAKLVLAEDLASICRRLLVIAAEDIGLAYPNAIMIVKACVDSAIQLGFPEARIPLSQATILLSTAPKSTSAITAIDAAIEDVEKGLNRAVNKTDDYYNFGDNKIEQAALAHRLSAKPKPKSLF